MPGDVGDGGTHRVGAAGHDVGCLARGRGAVGDEVGPVREVLDERAEHADHGLALAQRRVAQVDALVIAGPERRQRLGPLFLHADLAGAERGGDDAHDERAELGAAPLAAQRPDGGGQLVRRDDAGEDGVLPVVADVGDAVGPADHLALGGRRRGARPAVVGDAVDGLGAQVERRQGDQRAPGRVVEPAGHVGVERVLAGVAAGTVTAVVTERDGLGERHVEPAGPCDRRGDLRHLERMGERACAGGPGGTRRPGSCPPAGGRRWHGGCGRGRARSRCATRRAPRPPAGCRRPPGGWRRGPAARPRAPRAPRARAARRRGPGRRGRAPAAGAMRACESAWARRTGPE